MVRLVFASLVAIALAVEKSPVCDKTKKLYQDYACCGGTGQAVCTAPTVNVEMLNADVSKLGNMVDSQDSYDPSANPTPQCTGGKNVILMIGDGFGWEPVRAGAIAHQVLEELAGMGIPGTGTTDASLAASAKAAFTGRTLADYYEKGRGAGLEMQDLETFALMGASTVLVDGPAAKTITNRGNYSVYATTASMRGTVSQVSGKSGSPLTGERQLLENDHGLLLQFDPRDVDEGGMSVGWSQDKGCYPWQAADIITGRKNKTEAGCPGFDEDYRHNHATDSANTATAMATGYKVANNMMSVELYENPVLTLVEEAMACGKAGGVMSSVPILHATPGAFITHSAYRKDLNMNLETEKIQPTLMMGACASQYQPSQKHKDSLGPNFFSQAVGTAGADLLANMSLRDPDTDKVAACTINADNMPYRGIDSSYTGRHACDSDATTTETCDHYDADMTASVPKMKQQCEKAIEFMGKADKGFFLMMEQGDIDWALHDNHMDDMLGTILDFNDCMKVFKDWIAANGGYQSTALYVTADHDHFLHLENDFPERLADMIIDGMSHHMTPDSHVGPSNGLHSDANIALQWDEATVEAIGHFHAKRGQNSWDGHTNMPVPLYASGDGGCIAQQVGRGYKVVGKNVPGTPNFLDQVHLHECMRKQLFGY